MVKAIYLDQNKWIDLARARLGSTDDKRLRETLGLINDRVESGEWVLPLSAVHYIEVARVSDPRRRVDLGRTMWSLSQGVTMASYAQILRHELDVALARRFADVRVRALTLLGRGVDHAFGIPALEGLAEHLRDRLPPGTTGRIEESLRRAVEKSLLTGEHPDGGPPPVFERTDQNQMFMQHLSDLPTTVRELPRSRWHDALAAMGIVDIREPITTALGAHGLDWSEFIALGKDQLTTFLVDLPTRAIDLHMHWQIAKNPSLSPRRTDLEDWASLIPAAAHCDILVCEKHFADLLARDGFTPHAEVMTDVRALLAA